MLDGVKFGLLFPSLKLSLQERYRGAINNACDEFDISNPRRVAAFVAQISHESMGLQQLEELGGAAYFTQHYEHRLELGNIEPGDGARYHGRGPIQLTGRSNYAEFGRALGLPLEEQPELVLQIEIGARVAARYWETRGCNTLADHDDFVRIIERINGGTNGLEDRLRRWAEAKRILGVSDGGR